MTTGEKNERQEPSEQPAEKVKRSYAKPTIETFPLFERMALNCELKNTGEDDFS